VEHVQEALPQGLSPRAKKTKTLINSSADYFAMAFGKEIPVLLLLVLAGMLLLSGCPRQPTGQVTLSDSGAPEKSQPTVGELVESGQFPMFDRQGKGISLNLNEKTIAFNYAVEQDDTETMADACSSACEYVQFGNYTLLQSDGGYYCECSGEKCEDKTENGVLMRYCDPMYYVFTFAEGQ